MNKKHFIITTIFIIISVISGILSNDLIIGGANLLTALLCAYFSSEGKRSCYIFGLINYLLIGYVSHLNNLNGLAVFSFTICPILQIHGYLSWVKIWMKKKMSKFANSLPKILL